MYRAALRSSPRALRGLGQPSLPSLSRRSLATAPAAARRRTWKGTAVRWGLAVAAVYWYSTSPIFADEPAPRTGPAPPQFSDSDLPTVDAVIEEKRRQTRASAPEPESVPAEQAAVKPQGSPEALEGEKEEGEGAIVEGEDDTDADAGQQGAFNPETGEINWDCPCLGGMAHGPCGEEFKTAFSCFVYSNEEPKGMDCIDKFQHMRDCFRQYPDIYGSELDDDEDEAAEAPSQPVDGPDRSSEERTELPAEPAPPADKPAVAKTVEAEPVPEKKKEATIPNKAVDATDANRGEEQ